jgi:hypothetical protein
MLSPAIRLLANDESRCKSTGQPTRTKTFLPDPSPYEYIVKQVEWTSPEGGRVAFCLLACGQEARARAMAVYEQAGVSWVRVFINRDERLHPWKIALAELDGDAFPEVIVGTYKRTRFDPAERNRLFVFDWTKKKTLFPKWLGSSLGLPFCDFGFARDGNGIDRLLTLEHAGRERLILRQYRWTGFGFSHDRDWMRMENARDWERSKRLMLDQMMSLETRGVKP